MKIIRSKFLLFLALTLTLTFGAVAHADTPGTSAELKAALAKAPQYCRLATG